MSFIDITGTGDLVNLALVRHIKIKSYGSGRRMGLELTYANGEEDHYVVSPGRWSVLEDVLLSLQVAV